MYRYTKIDQATIDTRVRQFRDQTSRYLAGELSEEQFRPLRLQDRKSTRLNSSHSQQSRMPSSA